MNLKGFYVNLILTFYLIDIFDSLSLNMILKYWQKLDITM